LIGASRRADPVYSPKTVCFNRSFASAIFGSQRSRSSLRSSLPTAAAPIMKYGLLIFSVHLSFRFALKIPPALPPCYLQRAWGFLPYQRLRKVIHHHQPRFSCGPVNHAPVHLSLDTHPLLGSESSRRTTTMSQRSQRDILHHVLPGLCHCHCHFLGICIYKRFHRRSFLLGGAIARENRTPNEVHGVHPEELVA